MQAIIEGNLYEVEPAVKVIIDKLMIENAELKKENARLEEGYQKLLGVIAATDCEECKQKEQKITIPAAIEVIKNFCISSDCENCRWERGDDCMFTDRYPGSWDINYNKY